MRLACCSPRSRRESDMTWRLNNNNTMSNNIRRPFDSIIRASLVAQTVKNLPAMQETRVRSLGREDPLKKGMVTHSSILSWRISWTEEPCGLHSPWGHKESDMTEQLALCISTWIKNEHVLKTSERTQEETSTLLI